jgi:hypothetical protein
MTGLVQYDSIHHRLYLCGRRLHHGLTGAALATLGLVLMWDDRHDAPWTPARRTSRAAGPAAASASSELPARSRRGPRPLAGH